MRSFNITKLRKSALSKRLIREINIILEDQEGYQTDREKLHAVIENSGSAWIVLDDNDKVVGFGECSVFFSSRGAGGNLLLYIHSHVAEYGIIYKRMLEKLEKVVNDIAPLDKQIKFLCIPDSPSLINRIVRHRILHELKFVGSKGFFHKTVCN
jgi:hypothetical protein